jgi:hypothetical protein
MIRGDLVHIPQSAFLLKEVDGKNVKLPDGYIRTEKPMKALFWDQDLLDPKWGKIYYKNYIWSVRMKDIYPISQEIENAS